ncbi:MAG: AI-2E family transporter [Saprospiraceae bacterium]|nr:AI-2E family transporter [Saprospiraceae bacterium]
MNAHLKLPFFVKATLLLVGFYVLISMLFIAQDIILPVIYATIIAIAISPAVNYLVKKNINRAMSIAMVLTIALLILSVMVALLSSQASLLGEAWPQLAIRFEDLLNQTVSWISEYFNISLRKINAWITHAKGELINNSGAAIGITLTTMGGMLAIIFLTPVYVFMILFYQPHLVRFLHKLFGTENNLQVNEFLTETKAIIQSYLGGLFAEFAIVAIMNAAGLLALGIEYAILLGIIGALLNIIPYLGGMIAVVLFMAIAFVTKSPVYVLYVFALYTFIQFVDNNYIVPKIVGAKVKLNALVCLMAVIAGAALWGIPGMFLSIPLMAIIKLLFDRVDALKPWGFLLGDTMPPLLQLKLDFQGISKKMPKLIGPFKWNSLHSEKPDKPE